MDDFIPIALDITLFGAALILPAVAVVVLLVVLMKRTACIGALRSRLDKLESIVERPRRSGQATMPLEPADVARTRKPAPRQEANVEAEHVESWIGRRALGWVAAGLLLCAVAFFLKHAFDKDWIGPQGRIAIGVAIGAGLCIAGLGFYWRGWYRYSQMLTGGGTAVLYLTTYAAFGYYHLLMREWAAAFLILLIVQSAALAVLYDAPAIAVMGIIGGLLNPILLATEVDQYPAFFTYLALLSASAVGLTVFRAWPAIATIALVGTQGLFWVWYEEHYEIAKLWPAILFQGVLATLFLAQTVGANLMRARSASMEDIVRALVNVFLFTFAAWWLLNDEYHAWLGLAALGLAAIYAALSWLVVVKRPDDLRLAFTLIATTAALVATAFSVQAEAAWITLGWSIEGLGLWWFGLRGRLAPLRYCGAVLLGLASCRLVLVDSPLAHTEPFVPFLNRYGLPALAVAGSVLLAALAARRFLAELTPYDRKIRWLTALGGVALLWLVLSMESYQYFTTQIDPSLYAAVQQGDRWLDSQGHQVDASRIAESEHLRWLAQTSLSIVWAAYAALVLTVGFLLRNVPFRSVALGLFALTLFKVVMIDMESLPGMYRVAAFLALAVVMGLAAWWYQKHESSFGVPKEEKVASHAA